MIGNTMECKVNDNNVHIFSNRNLLGYTAGKDIEHAITELMKTKEEVRMIFAAAPSQNEVLDYLVSSKKIEWDRIVAFNMDEYIGLPKHSEASFASYLNERLFNKITCKQVNLIDTLNPIDSEKKRYEELITEKPIDIVCLGIGENGHIAFNDPPVADFNDKAIIKMVQLDHFCRMQQVNEGCFSRLEDVPKTALTLTIPTIMQANYLFCIVPGVSKKQAVFDSLLGSISERCPATILRTHHHCKFYFDHDSYQLVHEKKVM